jgi:hypothetical protein
MALLQTDLPPSTAPVAAAPAVPSQPASTRSIRKRAWSTGRIGAGLLALVVLVLLGATAARATESLAVGVMAADLAFLVAVAAWSAVAGTARR